MTVTKKTMLAAGVLALATLALGAAVAASGERPCPESCPKSGPCAPCPDCPGC